MTPYEFTEALRAVTRQQASAVLLADTDKASERAMEALGNADDVERACRNMIATSVDETNYAAASVIARLEKASNRTREPYVRDQLRLACNQLRRLIHPAPADTEPIDIFIV